MEILIGSARSDENKRYSGGAPGDQRQTSVPDMSGEVSQQPFYIHKKGWKILRAKDPEHAEKLGDAMIRACDNPNDGYAQDTRGGIMKYGTGSETPCNGDCGTYVRKCVIEATGTDPGEFTTDNEAAALMRTGLFTQLSYKSDTPLYKGDILVTKTKGHTAIVTQGHSRTAMIRDNIYYEPTKILKYGANESGVRWIQTELNRHGYNLKVDGIWGTETEKAVRDFQGKSGLIIDGEVGPETRRELKK